MTTALLIVAVQQAFLSGLANAARRQAIDARLTDVAAGLGQG